MTTANVPIIRMRGPEWVEALHSMCAKHVTAAMTLVEIGSFGGESTEVFAQHAGEVVAIDPWDASYKEGVLAGCSDGPIKDYLRKSGLAPMSEIEEIFDGRVLGLGNVRKLKAFDEDAVLEFSDQSIDFLYIDSIHTYEAVGATIARWIKKMRPGAVVAGHDYCRENWGGVVRAVDDCFGMPDEVFADTSWVVLDAPSRFTSLR